MNKKIVDHFRKVDSVLFTLTKDIKSIRQLSKSDNFFSDLCEAIINQQLSDKAARTIFNKFKKLFPQEIITPEKLLEIPDGEIRKVGTSWKKVTFMKELAKEVAKEERKLEKLEKLTDQEVIDELTKLKGIGRWTAEMFLMFSLARKDIFSAGDLGLRRAIQKVYKLKKEPTPKQIDRLSTKWSPYRTYAALILWKSVD